jgi:hypothetical protein
LPPGRAQIVGDEASYVQAHRVKPLGPLVVEPSLGRRCVVRAVELQDQPCFLIQHVRHRDRSPRVVHDGAVHERHRQSGMFLPDDAQTRLRAGQGPGIRQLGCLQHLLAAVPATSLLGVRNDVGGP